MILIIKQNDPNAGQRVKVPHQLQKLLPVEFQFHYDHLSSSISQIVKSSRCIYKHPAGQTGGVLA